MKDKIVEEYEKTKKKKDPELDRATIKVRLPDDIMFKLFQMRTESSACRNKGFILDGYPKSYKDAETLFMLKLEDSAAAPVNEEENKEEANEVTEND